MKGNSNLLDVVALRRDLRPLRLLIVLLTVEILFSTIFIIWFCGTFNFSRWLVVTHLPLAAGFYTLTVVAPALVLFNARIRRRTALRHVLALIPGGAFAFLITLYIVDVASYRWSGILINYKVAGAALAHIINGRSIIPLSSRAWILLATTVIVVLGIFTGFGPGIFRGAEVLLLPESKLGLFNTRRRARKSLIAIGILLLAYGGYFYFLRQRAAYSEIFSSDPIVSFARNTIGLHDRDYPAFLQKLRQDELRCRENYRAPENFDAKNVVIIVVDSLRPDHLSLNDYHRPTTPFLDSLFRTGRLRRVSLATATCPESACGILSTLNSKTFKRQIPENFTLQELLSIAGYDTYFILSGDHHLVDLRQKYGARFTLYFDGNSSPKYDVNDDRLVFEGLERVPPHRQRPSFFLFHLMSPHILGFKQDEFRVYNPSEIEADWDLLLTQKFDRQTVVNNYDNSVLQSDAIIKKIFETLEQKQYLQNSIVIITGDHGESLGERGDYGHIWRLYQEQIRIPLLIYDSSALGYRNLEYATQIDIPPTITDRLRLPAPPCWEGVSLLTQDARSQSVHQTTIKPPCFGIIRRADEHLFKYIYCSLGNREELYDLRNDPNELRNLINEANPSLLQNMRSEMQRQRAY